MKFFYRMAAWRADGAADDADEQVVLGLLHERFLDAAKDLRIAKTLPEALLGAPQESRTVQRK